MAPPTLTNGVNPLTWNVPIVNPNGTPTNAFMRLWQEQFATNAKIPDLTTASGVSAALDLLGATKGSILYRSTFLWSALPGATGHDGWLMTWNNATGLPEWRVPAISAIPSAFYIDGAGVGEMALVDANGQEVLDASGFGIYVPNPTLPAAMIPPLVGVTDGSAAAAGIVGELQKVIVDSGTPVAVPNTTNTTIATLVLQPGDWDVSGVIQSDGHGTGTISTQVGWFGVASAAQPPVPGEGSIASLTGLASNGFTFAIPVRQVNITVATTIFLVCVLIYTGTGCTASGAIRARRMR